MSPQTKDAIACADTSDLTSIKFLYEASAVSSYPSLATIRKSLPSHVFERSALRSLSYVLRDTVMISLLAVWAYTIDHNNWPSWQWPVYWFAQGTMFWALFVLGHDCGHGSFSTKGWLNTCVGNILHSVILVPYWSWALSHRHHHKNTGHIDYDEPFAPHRLHPAKRWIPWINIWNTIERGLIATLGFIWFPYLLCYSRALSSHFNPFDRMFQKKRPQVIVSLICFLLVLSLVGWSTHQFGWLAVIKFYLAPVIVFASWLVVTTFLHHSDRDLRWYGDGEWSFVRGNLSTIDRTYGLFEHIVHDIGTHQIHHLFPSIPHYSLRAATQSFRKSYPHLACISHDSIFKSFMINLYRYARHGYVETNKSIFAYQDDVE